MKMPFGLGTDIIEIARIKEAIGRHDQFLKKIFTDKERAYCEQFQDPFPHFAGRFAAKEAIFKALGTGIQKESHWLDVEILGSEQGKPEAFFSEALTKMFPNKKVLVTISHCREYATATSFVYET